MLFADVPGGTAARGGAGGRGCGWTMAGLIVWLWLSGCVALWSGFVESRLQVFEPADERYTIFCRAVWVGPRLRSIGFWARDNSQGAGVSVDPLVVDIRSMECYEGWHYTHPQGRRLGDFSEALVSERLATAIPVIAPEEAAIVGHIVYAVLMGVRTDGIAAMTFAEREESDDPAMILGGADGRLRALTAYGEPAAAATFDFRRVAIVWLVLGIAGVVGAAWVRGRRGARVVRAAAA